MLNVGIMKMKALISLLKMISFITLLSCSTGIKFPISDKVPGADITLSAKTLESGNHEIIIKAKNLAAANRLSPSRKLYVVWGLTATDGIRNLGMISNENAESVKFETLTPFKLSVIFITAEDNGNLTEPAGEEITRILVKGLD